VYPCSRPSSAEPSFRTVPDDGAIEIKLHADRQHSEANGPERSNVTTLTARAGTIPVFGGHLKIGVLPSLA
jgi:hypothetical protein